MICGYCFGEGCSDCQETGVAKCWNCDDDAVCVDEDGDYNCEDCIFDQMIQDC
jgi:hypothetical protein